MILGVHIPDGTRVEVHPDSKKLLIIFDEKVTKMDLWKARFDLWLTKGNTKEEFYNNPVEDGKAITITHRNKISF